MANYDLNKLLSPIDFELLSKDLLEVHLGIRLENFKEGQDKGVDLRYASTGGTTLIVQCKRYASFTSLKTELLNGELPKIRLLNPSRYILTTSVALSPQQADELKAGLSPYIRSTSDIYGADRLNALLNEHSAVERRHLKLWLSSVGVLESILHAKTHIVSREELDRTIGSAKLYVRNESFDQALKILTDHHVCIISGLPGIGKTTLARMLLLHFVHRGYDIVKIEGDVKEARDISYHDKPRFYYYDDFLGQTALADKLNKGEDQRLLDFMQSVTDTKQSVFVLTTREYILNQAKFQYEKLSRENFDYRICVIDLGHYTRRIRAQILYNHLFYSDLKPEQYRDFVARRGYRRVVDHPNYNPRLVEFMTTMSMVGEIDSRDYTDSFIRNLDNPKRIWEHAYENQLSARARHLLVVLTTMRMEVMMQDLKRAFEVYHIQQCKRYSTEFASNDFENAMKELDGTFLSSRMVRNDLLVSFQNPSIRDFMVPVVLDGAAVEDVVRGVVYFEQIDWLSEIIGENKKGIDGRSLRGHEHLMVSQMQRTYPELSCAFNIFNSTPSSQYVRRSERRLAIRLVQLHAAVVRHKLVGYSDWIIERTSEIAKALLEGDADPSLCVGVVKILEDPAYSNDFVKSEFVNSMKVAAFQRMTDDDDYHTLADVMSSLPKDSFEESELDEIRAKYLKFADSHLSESGIDDPEELRDEASRLRRISGVLGVDTEEVQESFNDRASRIEQNQADRDDYDDDDRERPTDDFSDAELDAMFTTLSD